MSARRLGLQAVPTQDLRKALAALHREEMRCPLDITELTRFGLQHVALELLSHLRGLDARAVRAVLVAVLAERQEQ